MKYSLLFLLISLFFIFSCENASDPLAVNNNRTDIVIDDFSSTIPPEEPPSDVCVRTPGYWKNHPDEWPVNGLTIGTDWYPKQEIIDILNMPEKGDKSLTLFRAWVAAMLNLKNGADVSCIILTIKSAHKWLVINPVGSNIKASSDEWKAGEPIYLKLDDYNNGFMCAPACD